MTIEKIIETYGTGYDYMVDDGFRGWDLGYDDQWHAIGEIGWTATHEEVNNAVIAGIEILEEGIIMVYVDNKLF